MNAGVPSEACKDFCGGVNMAYELRDAHYTGHDEKLWLTLERATKSHAMICCGTSWKGVKTTTTLQHCCGGEPTHLLGVFLCVAQDMLLNTVSHTGLVDGHAYTVTGVTTVTGARNLSPIPSPGCTRVCVCDYSSGLLSSR